MSDKTFLCRQTELDENGGVFKVPHPVEQNITIVLIRKDGRCFAYRNVCPHYSIQLDNAQGRFFTYQNRYIMCAHHSAMFDIETGLCVDGPCKNHSLVQENVSEDGEAIYLANACQ